MENLRSQSSSGLNNTKHLDHKPGKMSFWQIFGDVLSCASQFVIAGKMGNKQSNPTFNSKTNLDYVNSAKSRQQVNEKRQKHYSTGVFILKFCNHKFC